MGLNPFNSDYKIYTQSVNNQLTKKPYYSTRTVNSEKETIRYFSSTDVDLYFGNFYIGEATSILYGVSQSTMAIFGYNSYVFDDVARGSRLVEGKFEINYVKPSYLFDVMNTLAELSNASKLTINKHNPLWDRSLDMFISFGNAKQDKPAKGSQLTKISSAYVTGSQIIIDNRSGEPIKETYNFIAHDIALNVLHNDNTLTADDLLDNANGLPDNTIQKPIGELKITSAKLNGDGKEVDLLFSQKITLENLRIKVVNDPAYFEAKNLKIISEQEVKAELNPCTIENLAKLPYGLNKYLYLYIGYRDDYNYQEKEFKVEFSKG